MYICGFSDAVHITFHMNAQFLGKTLNVQGMRTLFCFNICCFSAHVNICYSLQISSLKLCLGNNAL